MSISYTNQDFELNLKGLTVQTSSNVYFGLTFWNDFKDFHWFCQSIFIVLSILDWHKKQILLIFIELTIEMQKQVYRTILYRFLHR